MKILMVAEPFIEIPPQKYGGTERAIYYLIKGLTERGHEVTLLASGDSEVPCKLIPTCKEHISFGNTLTENEEVKNKANYIKRKTKIILKKLLPKFDIVHSHGFDLKSFQNFPNLTTLHKPFVLSKIKYFERRQGLFYVSVSENQQVGFPDLQYVGVCYNGMDPAEFPFIEKPSDYVSFIGRFDQDKTPHLAIELALKLGVKIKVAGKVDYYGKEYFEKIIKPYLSNPLVEYLGEIGLKQKQELLGNARVNFHPTGFREPFGLTVLEAAYCGTPTLAIKKGSMPELIEEGRTGYCVEDFVEGYHLMENLYRMDRAYISQRAKNLFNYGTMAKQYELAYQKVIEIFHLRRQLSEKTLTEMQSMRNILKGVVNEKGANK